MNHPEQHPAQPPAERGTRDLAQARRSEMAGNAASEGESQRAIAEVQAAIMLAKRFPRDQIAAADRIMAACGRVSLAEASVYTYSRGGQEVTGPSIRLAEAIAQNWGNLQFGIRELSQAGGESTVEAFAWDVETNTRQVKVFQVPHTRHTKQGSKALTDPRDIYETVANNGARRLRACILGIVPGDIVDAAVAQCEATMRNSGGAPEDQIKKLVAAYAEIGVTADMLARKLNHKLDAVNLAEVARLRRIFASLRDGYTTIEAEFGVATPTPQAKAGTPPETAQGDQEGGQGGEGAPEGQSPATAATPAKRAASAAKAKIGAGIAATLRAALKNHKISEEEFCQHFSLGKLEDLPTAQVTAATEWVVAEAANRT